MISVASAATFGPFDYTKAYTGGYITINYFNQSAGGDVVIPPSIDYGTVTTIADQAFYNCDNMLSITIPESVTSIGHAAFASCNNLGRVYFMGNAPTMGNQVFNGSGPTVYYLAGKTGFTPGWWQGSACMVRVPSLFTSVAPPATGKVGTTYSHFCSATGTPAPTFSLTSGTLPDGLRIDRSGQISGSPTQAGIFTGTITADNGIPSDVSSFKDTQNFTIDTNEYRTIFVEASNGSVVGGGSYLLNATATLTATRNSGYLFSAWTGDVSGADNPLSVVVNANKTITANFTPDTSDTDDDGLTNYQEIVEYGTNPILPDTDGDGLKDSKDAFPLDPAETLDTDRDGTGDNADTADDGDGLSDVDEINIHGTNPKRTDSDGDGLSDPAELQTHLTNPNIADTDSDGLSDGAEVNTYSTLPQVGDTDGDGFVDGYEVLTGHLPLIAADKPALVAEARTAVEFTFPSALGKTYRIEDSLDMTDWSPVETEIAGNGCVITRFYTTRNQQKRFFRVEEGVAP